MAAEDSVLAYLIQCPLCLEQYDMLERKPKIMDCAHTYCLECLTKYVKMSDKICPKCRQPFSEAPLFLKNNFIICEALEAVVAKAAVSYLPSAPEMPAVSQRFFCTRCNRDANDGCLLNGHDVCDKTGLVLKRATEAKEQARRQFEREGAVLKDLADSLESFSGAIVHTGGLGPRVQRELWEAKKQREVLDKTSKLVLEVPVTAFQDNGDVPRALDRFLLANSERLFALEEQKRMLEMAKKCTVTVRSEDTGLALGTSKTLTIGSGSSAEDRVLSYLVYLLLNDKQEPQGAAGDSCAAPDLESLTADLKKCVIDGDSFDGNGNDDSDSYTSSVVSEVSSVSTLPGNRQSAKKVFVAKIPIIATPEEIKELFSKFGKVLNVRFFTKPRRPQGAAGNGPKHHCGFIYVPDDATVENILRNRPIAYEKKGQFGQCVLHVEEDKSGNKHHRGGEAKPRQRQKKAVQKNGEDGPAANKKNSQAKQENEAARRVFANQVPLDSTERDLVNFFSKYGAVASVTKRHHGVGQKYMAFIIFKDEKAVNRVLASRPIMYNGLDLQVRIFGDKSETSALWQFLWQRYSAAEAASI